MINHMLQLMADEWTAEQRILQSRIPRLRRVAFATYFISAAVPSLRWVAKCQWHLLSNDRNEVKKDPAIIVFYILGKFVELS